MVGQMRSVLGRLDMTGILAGQEPPCRFLAQIPYRIGYAVLVETLRFGQGADAPLAAQPGIDKLLLQAVAEVTERAVGDAANQGVNAGRRGSRADNGGCRLAARRFLYHFRPFVIAVNPGLLRRLTGIPGSRR